MNLKKLTFRLSALITLCLLSAFSLTVEAASYTYYFDNSYTNWDTPHFYSWNSSGTPLSGSWPGSEMTKVSGTDNIWSYTMTEAPYAIIFDEKNGGAQTDNITSPQTGVVYYKTGNGQDHVCSNKTLEDYTSSSSTTTEWNTAGNMYWLEPSSPSATDQAVLHFDKRKSSNLKSDTGDIYVYTGLTVGGSQWQSMPVGAWDFSSASNLDKIKMTVVDGEDGHYTLTFSPSIASWYGVTSGTVTAMNLIIRNYSGTKAQNDDINISLTSTTISDSSDSDTDTDTDGLVYYFHNTAGWSKVNIYLWSGSGDSATKYAGEWPGTQVTETVTNANGVTLYKYTYTGTGTPESVIFNNGSSDESSAARSNQTYDLTAVSGNVYTIATAASGSGTPVDSYTGATPTTGPLGAVQSYTLADGKLTVTSENGTLEITPYAKDLVKVFPRPSGLTTAERASIAVVKEPESDLSLSASENTDYVVLAIDGGTTVKVAKTSSLVSFYDASGVKKLAESGGLRNNLGSISASFEGMGEAGFFGGGYNGNTANLQGYTLTMNNGQNWGWNSSYTNERNINIPVYVSTNGYGVYFDSQYRGALIKPSSSGTTYSSAAQNPISYFYFGGGSMQAAIQNYVDLTGHQEMPPFWALGYITSKYSFASRSEAETVVSSTKSANLPLDGIVFDIHWQGTGGASGMGLLNWCSNYSNPSEMMQNFRNQNVKTICITEPFFNSENTNGNYTTLKYNGYLADESTGNMSWVGSTVGLIDATNPAALAWMWNFYKARTQEGVEGWWLDLGEPEQHDSDARHKGGTVSEIHNEFGNLWIESVYNGMKTDFPSKRRFLMPRSGTAGMQRFSTFPWTGDIQRSWSGLQAQIPALVNGSMSGIGYLGSDVGGFAANAGFSTNANLYQRWVEFAVFSPMMRTHSETEPMPYLSAYSSQLSNIRKMFNLRYSYLPYIYTNAYRFTTEGTPLCLPVAFFDENPSSTLVDCKDEFLAGRDILVAPVVSESATSRSITLPAGKWFDLSQVESDASTVSVYSGSISSYSASYGTLPHFARAGSFIVRYQADTYTSTAEIDRSKLRIDYFYDEDTAKAGETTGLIYEDDLTTPDPIGEQKYLLTHLWSAYDSDIYAPVFTFNPEGYEADGIPTSHSYLFRIHNYSLLQGAVPHYRTASVGASSAQARTASSNEMTKYTSLSALKASTDAGYYESGNSVYINLPSLPAMTSVAIDLGGNGVYTSVGELRADRFILSYSAGTLSYQIPADATDGTLDIFTATGSRALSIQAEADGTLHQAAAALPQGVYIARLQASGADGSSPAKTLKFIVR